MSRPRDERIVAGMSSQENTAVIAKTKNEVGSSRLNRRA